MTVDIFQGQDFVRKQFPVQAVQVTPNNIDQLAESVKGEVKHDGDKEGNFSRTYIDVPVRKPLNKRQTQAYIGDWIVKQGRTFKVYSDKSFNQQFETKNGVVTQKQKSKPKFHKGGAVKAPNPGSMPKKRTDVPRPPTSEETDKFIKDAKLVGLSLDDKPNAFGGTVELVEGTKDSPQQDFIGVTKDSQKLSDFVKQDDEPAVIPELARLNENEQAAEEKVQNFSKPEATVPTEDLGGLEPGAETPEEIAHADYAGREIIEQEEAEIKAAVEAQLAQSPMEPEKKEVKPITLDQLNTQAGDTRTAQQIMTERNQV